MKAWLMAVGAFLFALGLSLMLVSHVLAYPNAVSVYMNGVNLSYSAEYGLDVVGLIMAPIGAAILAYGMGTRERA